MQLLRNLEEANAKKTPEQREKDRNRPPPDFGSPSDFMLQQALNELKGQPVALSKELINADSDGPQAATTGSASSTTASVPAIASGAVVK
jgi:carboxyl-terminal processing protease